MRHGLTIVKRTLLVPGFWPVLAVAAAAAWAGTWLAEQVLGGGQGFVAEARHGSLLFAALLLLSLAEPLQVADEARGGLLLLRHARGGGAALLTRWAALVLTLLPALALVALAAGGLPERPGLLVAQLGLLTAGGLALGCCLDRRRLVPALWALAVLAQLRGWLVVEPWSRPLAWCLPDLSGVGWSGLLWALAVLALGRGRLEHQLAR